MFLRLMLVLLFLAAVLGGIFGWKHLQQQQQAAMQGPPPPPVVASARVESETWTPHLTAVGSLVAVQGIDVANEVPGLVREIHFESGQTVKAGDLLIQIDDAVDQADLLGLLALRDLAEIKLKRLRTLLKDRSTSQSDYDEAKAQLDGTEAAVAAKRATIAKKRVLAPFAGKLGIRKVDLGDYLPAGAPIVPLNTLDPVYVDYSLPERELTKVSVGQEVLVTVAAYPGREFKGSISALDSGVDQKTRNLRLRATLANPDQALRPGMFAEAATLLPPRDGVLTLPRTAIDFAPYGSSVFLIEEKDGQPQVQRRPVTTGGVQEGRVEIASGLAAGERVVAAGQVKLRNGQAIKIDDAVLPGPDAPMGP
jgi:membrane fusion protein (multidrug efflux system)